MTISIFENEFFLSELCEYTGYGELSKLNSSIRDFLCKVIYRKLNVRYSLKYCHSELFRRMVNNSVEKSDRQISLDLSHDIITNISSLINVHTIYYCSFDKVDITKLINFNDSIIWKSVFNYDCGCQKTININVGPVLMSLDYYPLGNIRSFDNYPMNLNNCPDLIDDDGYDDNDNYDNYDDMPELVSIDDT